MRNDFDISISIKPKVGGNRYSQPVLETGYCKVQDALDQVNTIIEKKFGGDETIEILRPRRRRRRD